MRWRGACCALLALLGVGCGSPGGEPRYEEHLDPGVDQIAQVLLTPLSSVAWADSMGGERLVRHGVRLRWDVDNATWVYVEEAAAEAPEVPRRQRVYRLTTLQGGRYPADAYALPADSARFVGAWREAVPLEGLDPGDLTPLPEEALVFDRTGPGTYAGSPPPGGQDAPPTVTLGGRRLIRWYRAADADTAAVPAVIFEAIAE